MVSLVAQNRPKAGSLQFLSPQINSTAEWNKLGKPQHFLRSNNRQVIDKNRIFARKSPMSESHNHKKYHEREENS
ncbi:MAG: hypothetical protein AAGF83_20140 [Cyanobacteria bacterium P01_G01_bin.67]